MSLNPNSFRKIICEICGTEFLGNHSQAKYCSDECRKISLRKSWREYSIKNRDKRAIYHKKYYESHKEQFAEYSKKATKKYKANHKDVIIERQKAYNLLHENKYTARLKVRNALRNGSLIKKPCEICGELKVEAHHDDYSKPLEVIWLCKRHHQERNLLQKEGA